MDDEDLLPQFRGLVFGNDEVELGIEVRVGDYSSNDSKGSSHASCKILQCARVLEENQIAFKLKWEKSSIEESNSTRLKINEGGE